MTCKAGIFEDCPGSIYGTAPVISDADLELPGFRQALRFKCIDACRRVLAVDFFLLSKYTQ